MNAAVVALVGCVCVCGFERSVRYKEQLILFIHAVYIYRLIYVCSLNPNSCALLNPKAAGDQLPPCC